MGSSTKRKSGDKLRINKPLDNTDQAIAAGGSTASGVPEDINNICPMMLHVKLSDQTIVVGADLSLSEGDLYLASDPLVRVGTINAQILKTIEKCSGLGIAYPNVAVVENKQGVKYAEFAQ